MTRTVTISCPRCGEPEDAAIRETDVEVEVIRLNYTTDMVSGLRATVRATATHTCPEQAPKGTT